MAVSLANGDVLHNPLLVPLPLFAAVNHFLPVSPFSCATVEGRVQERVSVGASEAAGWSDEE